LTIYNPAGFAIYFSGDRKGVINITRVLVTKLIFTTLYSIKESYCNITRVIKGALKAI